ncbi:MAG: hypothetical protein DELT_03156 [Desulfovibrio sp.]
MNLRRGFPIFTTRWKSRMCGSCRAAWSRSRKTNMNSNIRLRSPAKSSACSPMITPPISSRDRRAIRCCTPQASSCPCSRRAIRCALPRRRARGGKFSPRTARCSRKTIMRTAYISTLKRARILKRSNPSLRRISARTRKPSKKSMTMRLKKRIRSRCCFPILREPSRTNKKRRLRA